MPRLLVVHHTPSPALQEMLEAVVSGARTDEIEGVDVVIRPALTAAVVDVLAADGFLLGTPVQLALGTLRRTRAAGNQPSVAGIGLGGAERTYVCPAHPTTLSCPRRVPRARPCVVTSS